MTDSLELFQKLLGKNSEEIVQILEKHPEIHADPEAFFRFISVQSDTDKIQLYPAYLSLPIPTKEQVKERQLFLYAINNYICELSNIGNWKLAAGVADQYQEYMKENPSIAHSSACAYAQIGQAEKALDCIEFAAQRNYAHMDLLEKDEDLKAVQEDGRFIQALEYWKVNFGKDLNIENLDKLENHNIFIKTQDLVHVYIEKILELKKLPSNDENWELGFQLLPVGLRALFDVYWLQGEVFNGGFEQYFSNSTSDHGHDVGALEGCLLFGDTKCAKIVEQAIEVNEKFKKSKISSEDYEEALDQLTSQFDDLDDSKESFELSEAYIKNHRDEFIIKDVKALL